MKTDKDELLMAGPFGGIGGRKQQQVFTNNLNEILDLKIKYLENKLGLVGRDDSYCAFDPYYCSSYNPNEEDPFDDEKSDRREYLKELEKKLTENYQSPNIILARKEMTGGPAYSRKYPGKCQVLILVNKNIYELPPHTMNRLCESASVYFKNFHEHIRHSVDLQGRLNTLSECGKYEDYAVVEIPGQFECREVSMENEIIKRFIMELEKKHRKGSGKSALERDS